MIIDTPSRPAPTIGGAAPCWQLHHGIELLRGGSVVDGVNRDPANAVRPT